MLYLDQGLHYVLKGGFVFKKVVVLENHCGFAPQLVYVLAGRLCPFAGGNRKAVNFYCAFGGLFQKVDAA